MGKKLIPCRTRGESVFGAVQLNSTLRVISQDVFFTCVSWSLLPSDYGLCVCICRQDCLLDFCFTDGTELFYENIKVSISKMQKVSTIYLGINLTTDY